MGGQGQCSLAWSGRWGGRYRYRGVKIGHQRPEHSASHLNTIDRIYKLLSIVFERNGKQFNRNRPLCRLPCVYRLGVIGYHECPPKTADRRKGTAPWQVQRKTEWMGCLQRVACSCLTTQRHSPVCCRGWFVRDLDPAARFSKLRSCAFICERRTA